MPELPGWPFIEVMPGGRELVVHGRHISYRRYAMVRSLLRIAALVYFYYVGKEAIEERKIIPGLIEVVIAHFLPFIILWTLLPIPKWICGLFFRTQTKVRFTPKAIIIGRRPFPTNTGVDIRFGAFEPVMHDRDVQRVQNPRVALYLLRFQKIQMVYGLRVVDIATIDNEALAQQFVVILQQTYLISLQMSADAIKEAGVFKDVPAE